MPGIPQRHLTVEQANSDCGVSFVVLLNGSRIATFRARVDAEALLQVLERARRVFGVHEFRPPLPTEDAPLSGQAAFGYGPMPARQPEALTVFCTEGGAIAAFDTHADARACITLLLLADRVWSVFSR